MPTSTSLSFSAHFVAKEKLMRHFITHFSCLPQCCFSVSLCLQSIATFATTSSCDLPWFHLPVRTPQDNFLTLQLHIALLRGAWRRFGPPSERRVPECGSDVGLNHTCHHCEHEVSKINGLCLEPEKQTQVFVGRSSLWSGAPINCKQVTPLTTQNNMYRSAQSVRTSHVMLHAHAWLEFKYRNVSRHTWSTQLIFLIFFLCSKSSQIAHIQKSLRISTRNRSCATENGKLICPHDKLVKAAAEIKTTKTSSRNKRKLCA